MCPEGEEPHTLGYASATRTAKSRRMHPEIQAEEWLIHSRVNSWLCQSWMAWTPASTCQRILPASGKASLNPGPPTAQPTRAALLRGRRAPSPSMDLPHPRTVVSLLTSSPVRAPGCHSRGPATRCRKAASEQEGQPQCEHQQAESSLSPPTPWK